MAVAVVVAVAVVLLAVEVVGVGVVEGVIEVVEVVRCFFDTLASDCDVAAAVDDEDDADGSGCFDHCREYLPDPDTLAEPTPRSNNR